MDAHHNTGSVNRVLSQIKAERKLQLFQLNTQTFHRLLNPAKTPIMSCPKTIPILDQGINENAGKERMAGCFLQWVLLSDPVIMVGNLNFCIWFYKSPATEIYEHTGQNFSLSLAGWLSKVVPKKKKTQNLQATPSLQCCVMVFNKAAAMQMPSKEA